LLALLAVCCLLLLAACGGGSSTSKTNKQPTPRPTATATTGPGAQLLAQTAQLLTSAQTLHGLFNATLSGQLVNGEVDSEVWRQGQDRSRTLVVHSTLNQFASGTLIVSDGKHIWQYNPAQKTVYYGSVSAANGTTTPGSSGQTNNMQQLLLGAVQTVFTHSTATLLSSQNKVNGHPVYTIQVASQQNQSNPSGGLSFSYTGTVSLDQQTKLPLALDLNIAGFADAQIAIPSLELNQPLNASLFSFTPPAGTKVESFPTSTGQSGNSLTLQQAEQQAGYHLLSIPSTQSAYHLQSIDALGAPGNQIYALTYTFNGQTLTLSEGKALANLPVSGQQISLRGTSASLSTSGNTSTLSWTEKGVGIQITGPLSKEQIVGLANMLS
jgi:outer membrane lipoprotein-sorting protein